jgi:precorrin-6B methylase 2
MTGRHLRQISLSFRRLQRFGSILRRSGQPRLALGAARYRCQEVVASFLAAGGTVTASTVAYRTARLPAGPFRGRGLGGLGYLRQLVDHGGTVIGDGDVFVATLPAGIRFESSERGLVDAMCMLVERFIADEYSWLEPSDRVVVDIGANIADSAIYFARRGALHVYGYEPDATAMRAARRNVEINSIRNITLTQAAVVDVMAPGDSRDVRFVDVLASASAKHPGALIVCKIDCEGCEYGIVNSSPELAVVAASVTQVMIEYHHRGPGQLTANLERLGFRVETAETVPGIGWIRARRAS